MTGRRDVEPPPGEEAAAAELARRVVDRVAPEEGEIFDVVREAYRRDPARLAASADGRDRMLGFGLEGTVALLTPLALGIGVEVVRQLSLEAVGALEVGDRLRGVLRRRRAADPPAALAPAPESAEPAPAAADHARIREVVLTRCRQAGVDPDRADLIADAVIGALTSAG
ncbi:hypothetical protein [Micromonospora auratinigra]|uniref:hypothetical protein n=1 Tax=Micromonospora auratinigra TaxID=261654 RepID=UPI0012FD8A7A|nr:hypothetical protein [Micromonospora auratinigra]